MLKETKIERDGVSVRTIRDDRQLCMAEMLSINGHNAFLYDVGESYDANPEKAQPCGCGNRVFHIKPMTEKMMEQYELDGFDYQVLGEILAEIFSVGSCPRCMKDKIPDDEPAPVAKKGRKK